MKFCSTMHYKSMSALFSVCCEIEGNGKKGLEKHFRESVRHREKNNPTTSRSRQVTKSRNVQIASATQLKPCATSGQLAINPKIKQTCCGKSKPRTLDILLKFN